MGQTTSVQILHHSTGLIVQRPYQKKSFFLYLCLRGLPVGPKDRYSQRSRSLNRSWAGSPEDHTAWNSALSLGIMERELGEGAAQWAPLSRALYFTQSWVCLQASQLTFMTSCPLLKMKRDGGGGLEVLLRLLEEASIWNACCLGGSWLTWALFLNLPPSQDP